MASFIKQFHTIQQINKRPLNDSQNDTQNLKQKMKQLQDQIESLQKLKSQRNHSSSNPPKSRPSSNLKLSKQQYPNQTITQIQPLKLNNIKSDKVTQLLTQIHAKSSARSKRKLSIQHSMPTQRQSINSIQQTLEKIDISSGRKKKQVGFNVYELKGLKHNVDSNIFNVTIAEIMTEEHQKYQMIKEIKRLKDKLKDLDKKKIQNQQLKQQQSQQLQRNFQEQNQRTFLQTQQRRRIVSNIQFPIQKSTARKSQTIAAGRIYSRSRVLMNYRDQISQNQDQSSLNNSRTTDELISTHRHSVQFRKNSNPLTWNPYVSLASNQKPGQIRTHRTRNHRISNSIDVNKLSIDFNQQNNQTSRAKPFFHLGKKKQIIKQINKQPSVELPQSQPIQSFKQEKQEVNIIEPKKAIQFVPQLKIDKMKQNQSIPDDFMPNFRQFIKEKLLSINLPPQPSNYETQSDLQSFGRILFALFDIYVQEQTKKMDNEYKVTKYKNCVLYRLNDEKNIVWYYDGRFYFGGWEINLIGQGKKEGFGLQILPNQYIYQGYFKNNKRDGYGIMFNHYWGEENKNVIYEGSWKDGLKHGKGYQAQPDLEYIGDFDAGLQTGYCKIKTQTTFYQGQIRSSIKQGKGHQILKNGDQYNGMFNQNIFHGLGEYKWKSGAYFYGNFVKGTRKGQGIWLSNLNHDNYDIYKGSYGENKKNGFGLYQWSNDTIYQGYFKNDLRHDEGLMKYPNGKAAKFMWKDGNKANKIYSKQEEQYRCNRNSAIKISPQTENDEDNQDQTNQNHEHTFRNNILNELNAKPQLVLFGKRN